MGKQEFLTRLRVGEIVLLALGSPIWLSLAAAAFAVVLSLYASLWAVIVSLWAVFAALAGSGLGCMLGSIVMAVQGQGAAWLAVLAVGLVCAGMAVFAFLGCLAITKHTARLTKNMAAWIKKCLIKEETA